MKLVKYTTLGPGDIMGPNLGHPHDPRNDWDDFPEEQEMDMALELEIAAESMRGAVAGIDGVDALLQDAGFSTDSSVRHQLAIVRSMLMKMFLT